MLETLPLEKITPAADNPRGELTGIEDLAATIKAQGLLQPLGVTPDGAGGYTLVIGHRRYAALQLAGVTDVQCNVLGNGGALTTAERLQHALVENGQREDLKPCEEARTYQALLDEHGLTQRALSEQIGVAQSQISKRLPLLKLPVDVQADVDAGTIAISDAVELAGLVEHPKALAGALADIKRGYPAKQAVATQQREIDRLAKRAAALTKMRAKKGLTVIDRPDAYGVYSVSGCQKLGKGWSDLPIAVGVHSRLGCHAVVVLHDGTTEYVCTKPSDHPEAKKSHDGRSDADVKAERAKTRERNKKLKAAQEIRAGVLKEILQKPALAAAQLHVARMAVLAYDLHGLHTCRIACQLLELEPAAGGGYSAELKALREYAAKGDLPLRQTALALALAAGETGPRNAHNYTGADTKAHYEFLQTHGYKPEPIELRALAGRA